MTAPSESNAAMQILGADAWARFDVWAGRAWDAAERAADLAMVSGPPANADDDLDHRLVVLFHSTSVARDFAAMTNPLAVVSSMEHTKDCDAAGISEREIAMLIDEEE